jgi:dihydroxyacetone kinase-like protein
MKGVVSMQSFANSEGSRMVHNMIKVIQSNKQYLSDIDGAIGDGDHGINMNKGFTMCEKELEKTPGDLTHSLKVLSKVLMTDIGGSMGPLYGMFFRAMAKATESKAAIDREVLGEMLMAAEEGVRNIGNAEVGDKTLLDSLVPAVEAYRQAAADGKSFSECAEEMKSAAIKGRDSTKDMIARVGRASRLGERSRGTIDAGAASCCMILITIADFVIELSC